MRALVVPERRLLHALQLGDDPLREHLPELDAPLIEGLDLPYSAPEPRPTVAPSSIRSKARAATASSPGSSLVRITSSPGRAVQPRRAEPSARPKVGSRR